MVIDEAYLFRTKIPPSFLYRAALIEPLSCVIHSYNQLKESGWETLLINGCGSIGTLMCFYLKHIIKDFNFDISVYDVNLHRSAALSRCFGVKCIDSISDECFDGVYECTNSLVGMRNSLRSVKRGGTLCILSHLYGEHTSFVYEAICKKELRPIFPLRNGASANMMAAIECIETSWIASLDMLIGIYLFDALPGVFRAKGQIEFNKQVIKVHMT